MRPHLLIYGIDFRRQSNRRLACVATYVGYLLIVGSLWVGGQLGSLPIALTAIPAALILVTGWWVLNEVAKPYSADKLDERELQVRNQAFFRSYQIIAGLTALGLIYAQLAVEHPHRLWLPSSERPMQALVWGFLLLSITLPHAFIAWQDPDYEA
jgi:hypothetical protein